VITPTDEVIGETTAKSGWAVTVTWSGLTESKTYAWYVVGRDSDTGDDSTDQVPNGGDTSGDNDTTGSAADCADTSGDGSTTDASTDADDRGGFLANTGVNGPMLLVLVDCSVLLQG